MNNLPSKKNNKHFWPIVSFSTIFLIILVLVMPFSQNALKYISAKISQFATVLSSELVLGTNDYRAINNESSLAVSPLLMSAAQMKADDMASKGYFSHVAPNGDLPWVWFNKIGYNYNYAGENLAVDFTESSDVTTAWINSAKHRANLLNTNFTEIGIGIATGTYEGHSTTFVVQFFGKPFTNQNDTSELNTKTEKLSSSSNAETAVVTRSDLPNGEVLGTESSVASSSNDSQIQMFAIVGVGLLVLIIIILKLISVGRGRSVK